MEKKLNSKIWKKTSNKKNYIVWSKKQKLGHNPYSVVVKKELNKWVTFVDMGFDGGVSILNRFGTKAFNLFIAKKYMRENQYSGDLKW